MAVRVAINGFGRTGRAFLRAALKMPRDVEVAAVNDLGDPAALARLLARDSVHGHFPVPVSVEHDTMMVGSSAVTMLMEPHPAELPWRELGIDVVIESTGRLTSRAKAAVHIEAGARRVIISAPAKDADATFVVGVNEDTFDPGRDFVVSNASCTTNCLAVLAKVLDDEFGMEQGFMTTVHAYTDDQHLVDALHKDPRRSRALRSISCPRRQVLPGRPASSFPTSRDASMACRCEFRYLMAPSPIWSPPCGRRRRSKRSVPRTGQPPRSDASRVCSSTPRTISCRVTSSAPKRRASSIRS